MNNSSVPVLEFTKLSPTNISQTNVEERSIINHFTRTCTVNPRSEDLRTQKLKFYLLRAQSLKVLSLKPGVDQCIAVHATLTASDFFLANFYPSGPFSCICPKTSFEFFPVLVVADIGSCVGPQNKLSQPASSRFLVNTTQLKNDVKLDHRPMQVPVLSACGI